MLRKRTRTPVDAHSSATTYCNQLPIDSTPFLAVLGVFSLQSRYSWRVEHRTSWMHTAPALVCSRFVVRGKDAEERVLNESSQHGDIVFVDAPAGAGRKTGPLYTLHRWLHCASRAWPRAMHIGKADDDVWAHLPTLAAHLQSSADALNSDGNNATDMIWGFMETSFWDFGIHRPLLFGSAHWLMEDCKRYEGNASKVWRTNMVPGSLARAVAETRKRADAGQGRGYVFGPSAFAKGPLWFMSSALVAELAAEVEVTRYLEATLDGLNDTLKEGILPWEDVWLGAVLSQVVRGRGRGLALVHIGWNVFTETWAFLAAPSTFLWHAKSKAPYRVTRLTGWARRRHCELPRTALHCHRPWVSCSGATWRRCEWQHACSAGCSTVLVGLGGTNMIGIAKIEYDRRRRHKAPADCATEVSFNFSKERVEW